ncbi:MULTISPECIES: hypothetical protein [unclassified Microbacterium]|uniref:hypothetical protein n=1 Tax=unclassified Microbacterium TaxID=2609290 RepID=UPI003019C625
MAPRKPAAAESTPPVDAESTPPVDAESAPADAESTPPVDAESTPPADDIPVFAPAEEPTPEAERVYEIPGWLAENYDELVADPNRNLSYTKLAERSADAGEHELAGWARQRAAAHGEDLTPVDAAPAGADTTRSGDEQ